MGGSNAAAEGWATEDDSIFRLLAEHPPPRPYGYADQLWVDLRSWRPLTLWAAAIACLVAGVLMGEWRTLLFGVALVGFYLYAIRGTVGYLRDTPAAVGLLGDLSPHPVLPDHSTAVAVTADGQRIPVSVRTRLVAPILDRGRRAEVLLLLNPRSEYGVVFGARAQPGPDAA